MHTQCQTDQETGQRWGDGGKTAKMVARHRCSDNGFYDAQIQDCGGWRFRAWCSNGVPGDWSTPYSDEGARLRGRGSALNDSRMQCVDKGYAGTNGASRDKGEWHFSHQCVNPGWHGNWQNNGCLDDGQTRWSRQVNANGLDWNVAADWLINNNEVKQHKFSSAWKDNRGAGGMWVVANRDDGPGCKPEWSGDWVNEGCKSVGKRQWARRVNAKSYTWENAAEWLRARSMAPYPNNTGWRDHRGGGGMWVVVQVDDATCNPGWHGEWSNRDGCQADGQTRWSRRVDAKGADWNAAADWLITNDTKQHNFSRVWKENNNGMWVIALRNDNACFIYNGADTTNECVSIGNRRITKKCNNWPGGWTASNTVVDACKPRAPSGSTVKIFGSEVWAEWNRSDSTCNPGWLTNSWKNDGCQSDGQTRYSRQVDAKGIGWKAAADWLIANDSNLKEQKFSRITTEQNVSGIWVIGFRNDNACFVYNGQVNNDGCVDVNKSERAQQCNNWPAGWTASNTVVDACKTRAPPGSNVSINGTQVWAKWTVDDATCVATPERWSANECVDVRAGSMWTKLSVPGKIDWAKAATSYSNSTVGKVVNGKSVTSASGRSDANGAYSTINYVDNACVANIQGWSTPSCVNDTTGKIWTKLTVPGKMDWKKASDDIARTVNNTIINGNRVNTVGRSDTTGAYVDAVFSNLNCKPKSFILSKPYVKNDNLDENIKGIPARFAEAITNAVPFI